MSNTRERDRLAKASSEGWRTWGPYVSDRQWGTVREDYSPNADPWKYFSHDAARMRAYRWGEDAIGGFCDDHQNICLAPVFWNGQDAILKERLFGLINGEGNHGEDVKELYHYLDCTPTSSYAKMRYRYPQVAFPYGALISRNAGAGAGPEVELFDVLNGVFAAGQYFDITIEYAKLGPQDLLCRITVENRSSSPAPLHVLPQLWYRNYWSWQPPGTVPAADHELSKAGPASVTTSPSHPFLSQRFWYVEDDAGNTPNLMFTNNDTHDARLRPPQNPAGTSRCFKDAFHLCLIKQERDLIGFSGTNQDSLWVDSQKGSKAAAHFQQVVPANGTWEIHVRFSDKPQAAPFASFASTFATRINEANDFYAALNGQDTNKASADRGLIQRQALAGLLWNQQFYYYNVERWLAGDNVKPPEERIDPTRNPRNYSWRNLDAMDVLLMPDPWEYPWFAAWDLAFHCVAVALVDPELAKGNLLELLNEHYMQANGQIPAYEWEFGDVNPPVTAWAALQVYQDEKARTGTGDRLFLSRVFHKALLNFTWWVNRVDAEGDNLFAGGFLGLDNISVFDRSVLPSGQRVEQADGTGWVAMYAANLFAMAAELALTEPEYEDLAIKFLDHFVYIAQALNHPEQIRPGLQSLWDGNDGFYYDHLYPGNNQPDVTLRIRSVVGLVPLLATATVEASTWAKLTRLDQHRQWLVNNRPGLVSSVASLTAANASGQTLLSLLSPAQLKSITDSLFNENELLSSFGVRSLSKEHVGPRAFAYAGRVVRYDPAEASYDPLKGGNSNWRGPIWVAINYMLCHALGTLHRYHGTNVSVTLTSAAGVTRSLGLDAAAVEVATRVLRLFERSGTQRPIFAAYPLFAQIPGWNDDLLLHEYFDAETGKGLGAGHQGWTSLIANLIEELAK